VVVSDGTDFLLVRGSRVRFIFAAPVRIGVTPWLETRRPCSYSPTAGAMAVVGLGALRAVVDEDGLWRKTDSPFPPRRRC